MRISEYDISSSSWASRITFELTRRRESKHPSPHQASCERRSRRSRPTICSAATAGTATLAELASANTFHRDVGGHEPEALPEAAAVTPGPKHPSNVAVVISLHQMLDEAPPNTLPPRVLGDRDHRDVAVADAVAQGPAEPDHAPTVK